MRDLNKKTVELYASSTLDEKFFLMRETTDKISQVAQKSKWCETEK